MKMFAWQFANQSTSNSSGRLKDTLHPWNPTKFNLPEDSTALPLGRRHFNLPWHLRQGQCLGLFPEPHSLCPGGPWYWYGSQLDVVSVSHNTPHCTASCLVPPQRNCFLCPSGAWQCASQHPSCGCTHSTTLSRMLRSGAKKDPWLMNIPIF